MVLYKGLYQQPFPPKFRTKFVTEQVGVFDINGQSGENNDTAYCIAGNCMYLPWDIAALVTINGGASGGWPNASLSNTTLMPVGFSNVCNISTGPYSMYKVYASKCRIQLMPLESTTAAFGASTMNAVLYPYPCDYRSVSGPETIYLPTTYAGAQTVPYGKTGMFATFQRMNGPLSCYMTTSQIFGVNKRTIDDDPGNQFAAPANAIPTNPWVWAFNWTAPSYATGSTCNYRVKVTYYVELSNLLGGSYSEGTSA